MLWRKSRISLIYLSGFEKSIFSSPWFFIPGAIVLRPAYPGMMDIFYCDFAVKEFPYYYYAIIEASNLSESCLDFAFYYP
jgi:hypothetical protein